MNPNLELPGKEASQVALSPFETVVAFDPVRPLARIPVLAGQGDDLSKGPYVLAFRNEEAWRRAWRTCKQKIEIQCQAGAKLGCSIGAAKACGPPWWKLSLPFLRSGAKLGCSISAAKACGPPWCKLSLPFLPSEVEDPSKREECEAREMLGCLVSAQDRCFKNALEICDPAFATMRIAAPGAAIDRRFNGEPLQRPRVTRHDKLEDLKPKPSPESLATQNSAGVHRPEAADVIDEERLRLGVTTFQGHLVMQREPREERERILNWNSSHGPQNQTNVQQQSFPKEGWVGGLVHPAPKKSSVQTEKEVSSPKEVSIPKGPVCIALDLWQKLQESVIERFGVKRV